LASSPDANLRAEFHRRYDVSYVASELPRPPKILALKHYLASAVVYGAVLLFYALSPWFSTQLRTGFNKDWSVLRVYCYAYAAYLLVCPLVVFLGRPRSLWVSKNIRIVGYFAHFIWRRGARRDWRPTYEEKHALMFLLIKIIYGPMMICSALSQYHAIAAMVPKIHQLPAGIPRVYWLDVGYELFLNAVFLLDSMLYMIGYHSESGLLRNKLRYVETNVLHILVCLACYPPFNSVPASILGQSYQDYRILWGDLTHPLTWVLRGLAVLFLLLLVSSSLSLFTRASNLTNRGIVDWGPFRFVRHPGYFAKNMFWLLTLLPLYVPHTAHAAFTWPAHLLFCTRMTLGFLCWATIYFLRAVTEERFLMRDPDYVAYCKKVRYRFIPRVY
jgi:protein-S-isoprenylcysteine O-methyltransferase Ste14